MCNRGLIALQHVELSALVSIQLSVLAESFREMKANLMEAM